MVSRLRTVIFFFQESEQKSAQGDDRRKKKKTWLCLPYANKQRRSRLILQAAELVKTSLWIGRGEAGAPRRAGTDRALHEPCFVQRARGAPIDVLCI